MLFTFCEVFSVANVDYSKTDSFELLFKTITCNKFFQTKSMYVFTSVVVLLGSFSIAITSDGLSAVHV